MQASAAAFGTTDVIEHAGNLRHFVDTGKNHFGVCSIAARQSDRSDAQHPLNDSLSVTDVVDIDDFDSVSATNKDSGLVHKSLGSEFVVDAQSLVDVAANRSKPTRR